jgi:hypothetical protein
MGGPLGTTDPPVFTEGPSAAGGAAGGGVTTAGAVTSSVYVALSVPAAFDAVTVKV